MLKTFLELNIRILLILLCFGFICGFLRRFTIERLTSKRHGVFLLDFFNLIGIPVHEFGHLIFGVLFGYRVTSACFYRTIKKSRQNQGTLGYVQMVHRKNTWIQGLLADLGQFFIGIGPLIVGPGVIFLVYQFLPDTLKNLLLAIQNEKSAIIPYLHEFTRTDILFTVLFLYLVIGISLNMELSRPDLELAWKGLIFLELLFLLIAAFCHLFSVDISNTVIYLSNYLIFIASIGVAGSLFSSILSLIGL